MGESKEKLTDKLAGKFIVIDGPDGAGKTTQLKMLANYLRQQGVKVTETRDPGGTAIGDKIRKILLDRSHTEMIIGCEILLYMASRTQLMGEVIAPALQRGDCVLCDRWVSSTIAYQVADGVATANEITDIYEVSLRGTWPNLTLILDVPAETGLGRITRPADRMEAKGPEFHERVRQLFLKQAKTAPERFVVVGAAGAAEQVHQRLRDTLENWKFGQ